MGSELLRRFWTGLVGPVPPRTSGVIMAGAGAATCAVAVSTPGPVWRRVVMGAMAFDIVGGMVAFQVPATRAEYARKSSVEHLGFVAAHLHPAVLAALGEGSWTRNATRYAYAVAVTEGLQRAPLSPQARRRAAMALGLVAAVVDLATDRSGSRWFGPAYLKLVAGHAGIGARARRA
ncbi:hypothetical protein GCM10027418_17080 [Mariniluteicoccus endophyticus]